MSEQKKGSPSPAAMERSSFGIRRVGAVAPPPMPPTAERFAPPRESEGPESLAPASAKDATGDVESAPSPAPDVEVTAHTGALFRRAADALSFLGAVSAAGLAARASSLRGPNGRFWVEVPVSPRRAAPLAFLGGGRPFAGRGASWTAVLSDGNAVPAEGMPPEAGGDVLLATGARIERLRAAEWQDADLRALLGETSLRRIPWRPRPEIAAAVPPALARWILARATALGIQVSLAPAERRPLIGDAPAEGVVWMRMRAAGAGVPRAWIASLTDLPGAVVTCPVGTDPARLFVDARCEAPLSGPLLEALLPGDEAWLLGAADVGHARIRAGGELVDGGALLMPPAPAAAPLALPRGAARMPAPIQVRLVRRHVARPTDAVLLDETELGWLRTYLMTRTAGEAMFVVGGGNRYLVLAAGDLAATVPFGVELCRVGPGGLYLEQGLDFFPPLPEEARLSAFRVSEREVVVLTEGGSYRFEVAAMVPAWSLWAGAPPPMEGQVPGETTRRLQEVSMALQWKPPEPVKARPAGRAAVAEEPGERARLREEAARAEVRGELVEAARLRERAGDFRAAARLYERAAGGAR